MRLPWRDAPRREAAPHEFEGETMYRTIDRVTGTSEPKVLTGYGRTFLYYYYPQGYRRYPAPEFRRWDYTTNDWEVGEPSCETRHFPFEPPYNRVGYIPVLRDVTLEYQRSAVTEFKPTQVTDTLELLYGTSSVQYRKPRKPVYHPPTFRGRAPKVPRLLSMDSFGPLPSFSRLRGRNAEKWKAEKVRKIMARREATITRVNSERLRVYNARQAVFEGRYKRYLKLKEEYEALYSRRVSKYELRLSRWNAWQERNAKGYLRATGGASVLSENEYTRLRLQSDPKSPPHLMFKWSHYDPGMFHSFTYPAGNGLEGEDSTSDYYQLSAQTIAHSFEAGINRFLDSYEVESGVVRKLYDRLADQRVHIGNIIAERQQTFDMIVNLWRSISDLVHKKRSLLELTGSLLSKKGAANAILQLQFGLKPLVDDVMSAIGVFEGWSELTAPTFRVKASMPFREVNIPVGGFGSRFSGQLRFGYTAVLKTDTTPTRVLQQLGLIDPTQIAWEVAPWSFVVDWFIPVGEWIMAQTSDVGLQSWVVMRSFRALGQFSVKEGAGEITDYRTAHALAGTATITGDFLGEFKSRRFVPLPAPSKLLHFKSPMSVTHGIEAVALALQRFK